MKVETTQSRTKPNHKGLNNSNARNGEKNDANPSKNIDNKLM